MDSLIYDPSNGPQLRILPQVQCMYMCLTDSQKLMFNK